jgi:hypothetical protein
MDDSDDEETIQRMVSAMPRRHKGKPTGVINIGKRSWSWNSIGTYYRWNRRSQEMKSQKTIEKTAFWAYNKHKFRDDMKWLHHDMDL